MKLMGSFISVEIYFGRNFAGRNAREFLRIKFLPKYISTIIYGPKLMSKVQVKSINGITITSLANIHCLNIFSRYL